MRSRSSARGKSKASAKGKGKASAKRSAKRSAKARGPNGATVRELKEAEGRLVMVARHGTKVELHNRFDLPILPQTDFQSFCGDGGVTFGQLARVFNARHKAGRPLLVIASPFLRTRQTSERLAQQLGLESADKIYTVDALGETFDSVMPQLRACNEKRYRVPSHGSPGALRSDACMKRANPPDQQRSVSHALHELAKSQYEFDDTLNKWRVDVKSSKDLQRLFKTALLAILEQHPTHDVVVVTHAGNVRRSLQVLSPRNFIPRTAGSPPTCGSAVFEEDTRTKGKYTIRSVNFFHI